MKNKKYKRYKNNTYSIILSMGGNAIKKDGKSICGRLMKNKYNSMKNFVFSILSPCFVCEIVRELPGKEDFGDMDVLFVGNPNINDMRAFIKNKFNVNDPSHIVSSGEVISFALALDTEPNQYFQIDLIRVSSIEYFDMARFYFSYGDVGSIIGRISNYHGLKFGDAGLWCDLFDVEDTKKIVGKIMLSSNPKEICDYMGFNYDFWKSEIPKLTTREDHKIIFDWLKSSWMFDIKIFTCLNLKHRNRQAHRPFYRDFLEYNGIFDDDIVSAGAVIDTTTKEHRKKSNIQNEAIKYFKKENTLKLLLDKIELKKLRQSKFSGIQLITAYEKKKIVIIGSDIGKIIKLFENHCLGKTQTNSWEEFLDIHTKEEINDFVDEFVNETTNTTTTTPHDTTID
jgi:hypothetical protein